MLRFHTDMAKLATVMDLALSLNEIGAAQAAIKQMLAMLEAKRTLLLAISHELRSPLTRARLNTELLPETPELQTNREALLRDLALMRDLVTDLLESERLASPHAAGFLPEVRTADAATERRRRLVARQSRPHDWWW